MATDLSKRVFGKRQCLECGAGFIARSPRSKYCGASCKVSVRRKQVNDRGAKSRATRPVKLHDRKCRRCENKFSTAEPYAYYCDECVAQAANSGRSKYQFLSRMAADIPPVRKCGGCESTFSPTWVVQKYCGPNCKTAARRATIAGSINDRMRSAVRRGLAGGKRGRRWESILGYTNEELVSHLKRQMPNGFTKDDLKDLHIDHIVPLASFEIKGMSCPEFKAAWALTNLRLLDATENLRKGARRTHLI